MISAEDFEALKEVMGAGTGFELTPTSRGVRSNQSSGGGVWSWGLRDRPSEGRVYEYYNVLWIVRNKETGVTECNGWGQVVRDIWEELDLT